MHYLDYSVPFLAVFYGVWLGWAADETKRETRFYRWTHAHMRAVGYLVETAPFVLMLVLIGMGAVFLVWLYATTLFGSVSFGWVPWLRIGEIGAILVVALLIWEAVWQLKHRRGKHVSGHSSCDL